MARTLPPLKSLASFEAAARHGSFTKAAEELSVTQSAISHQIRSLEANLGLPLFQREPRKLALTVAGKILLPEISQSLNKMSAVVAQVKQLHESSSSTLSIRLAPSFALAWLSPRLGGFWQKHPDVELCLYHSHVKTDFDTENIDMAVSYGKGDWPGVIAEPLLKLDFFPVCSPDILGEKDGQAGGIDFTEHPLLHEIDYQCWVDWATLAGEDNINPYQGSIIDDTNVLVQAAVDGKGIALGSSLFVEPYLKDGRLIRLADTTLENDDGYFVVYPRNAPRMYLIEVFRDWIFGQI